jgi:Ni2+-binding GTPase involved in maturation of urease and hydrogenase
MQLHLVGGFLGSGKTTAIMAAARDLISAGKTVGIITNDQGKYLVDTGFFKLADMPTVEVTGGCFCCNYDDLDKRLDDLIDLAHPDAIFAESVGSCADLVATVIKPMLSLRASHLVPSSFSVFVDCRLLRLHLMGESLPFAEDVIYIFEKQIEEAGLVIINKTDLLSQARLKEVQELFQLAYPQKASVLQNSLALNGTAAWLKTISSGGAPLPETNLEINYQRYGSGEAQLAWLDEEWTLPVKDGNGRAAVIRILNHIVIALKKHNIPIGHLKFLLEWGDRHVKLSLTTLEQPGWLDDLPQLNGATIKLLINGRVQMDASLFKDLVDDAIKSNESESDARHSSAFHPSQPQPTHRFFDKPEEIL